MKGIEKRPSVNLENYLHVWREIGFCMTNILNNKFFGIIRQASIAAIGLMLWSCSSPGINFNTKKLSDRSYMVTLTSDKPLRAEQAQDLISSETDSLCGNLPLSLGQYKFRNKKNIGAGASTADGSMEFNQVILCGVTAPATSASSRPLKKVLL